MKPYGNACVPSIKITDLKAYTGLFIALLLLAGCSTQDDRQADSPLVSLGNFSLYRKDIPTKIYEGKHGKDSVVAARDYIKHWIEEHSFLYFALKNTDTARINRLTRDYRNALLRDFYEARLQELGMDSVQISRQELREYYDLQKEHFRATDTFIRWRYLIVSADNPKRYRYRNWFYSSRPQDREHLEAAYKDLIALQPDTTQWTPLHIAREIFPGLELHKPEAKHNPLRIQKTRDNRLYLVEIIKAVYPDDILPFGLASGQVRYFLKQRKWQNRLKDLRRKMMHEAEQQKLIKYYVDE